MVTKYDGIEWEKVGILAKARAGHRSIKKRNIIMHIGGYYGAQ